MQEAGPAVVNRVILRFRTSGEANGGGKILVKSFMGSVYVDLHITAP